MIALLSSRRDDNGSQWPVPDSFESGCYLGSSTPPKARQISHTTDGQTDDNTELTGIQYPLVDNTLEASKPPSISLETAWPASSPETRSCSTLQSSFGLLPVEIRLKIWSCAVEPRIVSLVDLAEEPESCPLPNVVQLNFEARTESQHGYEHIGNGSFYNFQRDILLCDQSFMEQSCNKLIDSLAPRIERVIIWDCFPDERVSHPDDYSGYLSTCYRPQHFGQIMFEKFWFPNAKELWFVKIGDVDRRWMMYSEKANTSYSKRLENFAREFRYWVDENIIEMAALDLSTSESKVLLREGRCRREDCREMNKGRDHIISKVNFMDGRYQQPDDGRTWVRIVPVPKGDDNTINKQDEVNLMRWTFVEKTLTFFLNREWTGVQGQERGRKSLAASISV